jgi:CBS domain-containing protein
MHESTGEGLFAGRYNTAGRSDYEGDRRRVAAGRENDRLVGMITDRDIAIRAVAEGKGAETSVRDVMTEDVAYCFDDDDIADAARIMGDLQVRRLPVLNHDKRLIGVISVGDLARAGEGHAEAALSGVTQPGGQHYH